MGVRSRAAFAVAPRISPAMNAPMASSTPSASATPAVMIARPTKTTTTISSSFVPTRRPTRRLTVPRHRAQQHQEQEGRADADQGLGQPVGTPEDRLQQRQVERQEDVPDYRDPQDRAGLAVAQPAGLDEKLGHDRGARTPREIAQLLTISVRTVERHRENILAKLGMRDRTELTRYAVRAGLIEA